MVWNVRFSRDPKGMRRKENYSSHILTIITKLPFAYIKIIVDKLFNFVQYNQDTIYITRQNHQANKWQYDIKHFRDKLHFSVPPPSGIQVFSLVSILPY